MLFIRTWIQAAKFSRGQMLSRAGTALITARSGTKRLAVSGQVPDLRSGSTVAPLAISNGIRLRQAYGATRSMGHMELVGLISGRRSIVATLAFTPLQKR
jgi:hypothetical protein